MAALSDEPSPGGAPRALPTRPRLRPEVAARRHVVGDAVMTTVHAPPPSRGVACLGEREWAFVAAADGTRDLEGIRLAAARDGRRATRAHVVRLFEELAAAGLLTDGVEEATSASLAEPTSGVPERPCVGLPRFRLRCDGSGTCCRLYTTTTFLPLDVARARALCPDVLAGGHHPERLFTPLTSSHAHSWEPVAVAMIDGRCAFLGADDSCSIHARGGAGAKPAGCRAYPLRFVDDGEVIRVGPAPECSCVFASPAVDEAMDAPRPDHALFVERLDETIQVGDGSSWSRARYLAWATERGELLATSANGVDALWEAAAELAHSDVSLTELAGRLARALEEHGRLHAWRHPRDLARGLPDLMLVATRRIGRDVGALEGETLYLRALSHLHGWALDGVPLAASLRERALRLLVARHLADVIRERELVRDDAAFGAPIALVEASCRAFDLTAWRTS